MSDPFQTRKASYVATKVAERLFFQDSASNYGDTRRTYGIKRMYSKRAISPQVLGSWSPTKHHVITGHVTSG